MASRKVVLAALTLLSRAFAGEVSEERVDVYEAAWDDVTDQDLLAATTRVIKTHRGEFIPPPAIVRDAACPPLDPARTIAAVVELGYNGPNGFAGPAVFRVRDVLGDAIADAYASADPDRLFSENEAIRGAARREFAHGLEMGVQRYGYATLPPSAFALPPGPAVQAQLTAGS